VGNAPLPWPVSPNESLLDCLGKGLVTPVTLVDAHRMCQVNHAEQGTGNGASNARSPGQTRLWALFGSRGDSGYALAPHRMCQIEGRKRGAVTHPSLP
jgi:hypothetical protein